MLSEVATPVRDTHSSPSSLLPVGHVATGVSVELAPSR